MLYWVLLNTAALSHTCCNSSLCPTSKLHQSDTCCTNIQSCFDHQNHSHHSLSACAAAAHTEHTALRSSHILSHTCHSRADAATVQAASCAELRFAVICHGCSQSSAHTCCIQHRSRQRRAYLSHNQSCSLECYTARAAGAVCYVRPGSQSWSHTCQRHPHSCHHSH